MLWGHRCFERGLGKQASAPDYPVSLGGGLNRLVTAHFLVLRESPQRKILGQPRFCREPVTTIPRGRAAGGLQGNPKESYGSSLSGQLRGLLARVGVQESVRRVHSTVLWDLRWLPVGWNGWLLGHGLLHKEWPRLLLPEPRSLCKRKENPQLHQGENRLDDNSLPMSAVPQGMLGEDGTQNRLERGRRLPSAGWL